MTGRLRSAFNLSSPKLDYLFPGPGWSSHTPAAGAARPAAPCRAISSSTNPLRGLVGCGDSFCCRTRHLASFDSRFALHAKGSAEGPGLPRARPTGSTGQCRFESPSRKRRDPPLPAGRSSQPRNRYAASWAAAIPFAGQRCPAASATRCALHAKGGAKGPGLPRARPKWAAEQSPGGSAERGPTGSTGQCRMRGQAEGAGRSIGKPGPDAPKAQKGRACHGTRGNDLGLLLPT